MNGQIPTLPYGFSLSTISTSRLWEMLRLLIITELKYSLIQKDGLNFVRLYFLNYAWYVNDLHNI